MAGRRRRRLEEQRRLELERQRQAGGGVSPFGALPFGGLLDAMLGGNMGWTRTMEYDAERDSWVDAKPESLEHPPAEAPPQDQRRFERTTPRRPAPANPLTTLLGGAMGGANGDFAVKRPDEFVTFADVGGMEKLKQETRDSIGLLLEHPDKAAEYGIETGSCCTGSPGSARPSSPRRSPASTA